MTQPGILERIATALETIATALTPTPTHTPHRPDTRHTQFEWEPTDQPPTTPLPEPAPPEERCGFLIEQYIHPLDRVTPVYQISKAGASLLLNAQQAAELAALSDGEFTATMAARLAEVLAQRHAETRTPTPAPAEQDAAADEQPQPEDDDERRQREWARTVANGSGNQTAKAGE